MTHRLRLLVVTERTTGGIPVVTCDLVRGLAEAGCAVRLLGTFDDGKADLAAAVAAGVTHIPWGGLRDIQPLVAALRQPADAVLSCHRGCDVVVGILCRLFGIPHVSTVHSDPLHDPQGLRHIRLRNALWRQVLFQAAGMITISRWLGGRLTAAHRGLPPATVVPNARSSPVQAIAQREAPGPTTVRLVACGRLEAAKHPRDLIALVIALDALGIHAQAVWVGDGDVECQSHADAAGLAHRVRYIGHQADPTPFYAEAHMLVHFCAIEGFGLVLLEAMALGLPVVAVAAGAIPEVVPADAGILVPPRDTAAMAAAVATVVGDPLRWRSMSQAAQRAAGDFTVPRMARGYIDAIHGFLAR